MARAALASKINPHDAKNLTSRRRTVNNRPVPLMLFRPLVQPLGLETVSVSIATIALMMWMNTATKATLKNGKLLMVVFVNQPEDFRNGVETGLSPEGPKRSLNAIDHLRGAREDSSWKLQPNATPSWTGCSEHR